MAWETVDDLKLNISLTNLAPWPGSHLISDVVSLCLVILFRFVFFSPTRKAGCVTDVFVVCLYDPVLTSSEINLPIVLNGAPEMVEWTGSWV